MQNQFYLLIIITFSELFFLKSKVGEQGRPKKSGKKTQEQEEGRIKSESQAASCTIFYFKIEFLSSEFSPHKFLMNFQTLLNVDEVE